MDTKTIILALAFGSFIFGFLLILFQYDQERSRRVPFWITSKFMQGTGTLIFYYSESITSPLGMMLSAILLLSGCAYEGWAVFHITGRTVSRKVHSFTTTGIIAICAGMMYLTQNHRMATTFLLHTLFYLLPGLVILRNPGKHSPLRTMLAYSYLLLAGIFFAGVLQFLLVPYQSWPAAELFINQITLPSVFFMMLISGFSMLLLAKEKIDSELDAALQAKKRFLQMVSHEFRTPLGLLSSSTDIVYHYWDRLTPEERTTQTKRIHSGVEQINSLISSILSFNQPKNNDGEASIGFVAVGALCQIIAEEVETVWNNEQVFCLSIAENCADRLVDENLFRRVVQNLLTNAFSYTEPGGDVTLRLAHSRDMLLLDVSDSGIGIDMGDQKNIFDKFFRGQNIGSRRGLGLGLSIVQEALTLLKGSIRVESSIGHGTTMHVTIPLIPEPK